MFGFTIDTIKLFLSPELYSIEQFEYLRSMFCNNYMTRGEIDWYYGINKNVNLRISENNGMYLTGSLSNYYCDKKSILPLDCIPLAIGLLENNLNIDLSESRVLRIDIALNVRPNLKASNYGHYLFTDIPRFKRLVQDDGLRFENRSLAFAYYNKSKELFEKRGIETDVDILRFEFRIKKKLRKYLNSEMITVIDLYKPETILVLIELFERYFNKIKLQMLSIEESKPTALTPKKFSELLVSIAINEKGSAFFYEFIEQLWDEGRITSPVNKSRCRDIVQLITRKFDFKVNPLAKELESLVTKEIERTKNKIKIKHEVN